MLLLLLLLLLPPLASLVGEGLKVLAFGVVEDRSSQVFGVGGTVVAERGVLGLEGDFLLAFLIDVARVGDLRISGDGDSGDDLLLFFLGDDEMLPRPDVGEMGDVIPWMFRVRRTGA